MVAFTRPALGCAHTVGFTEVFIARDGPPRNIGRQTSSLIGRYAGVTMIDATYKTHNSLWTFFYLINLIACDGPLLEMHILIENLAVMCRLAS